MARVIELATEAIQQVIDTFGTTAKTLITPVFNIKGYGAIGDGVTHPLSERYSTLAAAQAVYPHAAALTDEIDWAATQMAINQLPANAGTVFAPEGTYLLNKTITIVKTGTKIMGAGMGATIFQTSSDITMFLVAATTVSDTIRRVRFTDMTVRGFNADGTGHNIHFKNAIECFVDNCWVYAAPDHNIFLDEVNSGSAHNITITSCSLTGAHGWGLYTESFRTCVVGTRIQGNTTGGVYSQRGALSVFGCDVEGNGNGAAGEAGILMDQSEPGLVIAGCYFETNNPTNVKIGHSYQVFGTHITGSRFYTGSTTTRHIWGVGAIGLVIEGNTFYNAQTAAIRLEAWNAAANPRGCKNVVIQGNAFTGNAADISDAGVKGGTLINQANDTGEL